MKFNYHTHSFFSDGHQSCQQAVEAALKDNFESLGFSDHGIVPFPNKIHLNEQTITQYLSEITKIQLQYKDKIQIFKSVEADYIDNICDLTTYDIYDLDYIIGAVHYFPFKFENGLFFNFDSREDLFVEGLNEHFGGNIQKMVSLYFEHIQKMIISKPPDIIAHLDIIGKFNLNQKYYDDTTKWHKSIISGVLDTIYDNNCIIEVNARRKYKKFHEDTSPTTEILQQIRKKNIPITISGDIHYSQDFSMYWEQTIEQLKNIGFGEIMYFDIKGWHEQKL